AGSLALYYRAYNSRESQGAIFTLQFGFGGLIESIVTRGEYAAKGGGISGGIVLRAYRMPVIPYFMAAVAGIQNSLLLATLVKNVVWAIPWAIGWLLLLKRLTSIPRIVVLVAVAFALSFPYLALCMFMLDFEEGYLIGPMFVFSVLMFGYARQRGTLDGLSAPNRSAPRVRSTPYGGGAQQAVTEKVQSCAC